MTVLFEDDNPVRVGSREFALPDSVARSLRRQIGEARQAGSVLLQCAGEIALVRKFDADIVVVDRKLELPVGVGRVSRYELSHDRQGRLVLGQGASMVILGPQRSSERHVGDR